MEVRLKPVRIAFANIFTPKRTGDSDEPRYSAAFPIEPDSENAKMIDAAVEAVATEKWGKKAKSILADIREKRDICWVKSPLKDKDGEVYDGFEGMWALNAGQGVKKGAPTVVDRERNRVTEEQGLVYSGCWVVPLVDIWAQDNQWGRRINAQLKGVQFYRRGDAFGGGAPARPDDFEDLGVDEEAEDDAEDLA